MAIHGYKVNDKEFQKIVDKDLRKRVTKLSKAALSAMKDITENVISQFYKMAKSPRTYTSIPKSAQYRIEQIKQDSRMVYIDVSAYIDEGIYYELTKPYYEIYNWADRHSKSDAWASQFVIGLQWDSGIIGLPGDLPHYSSGIMSEILRDALQMSWKRKVNKYLK